MTRSIVPRVRAMSSNSQNTVRTLLCTCVDHYASSYGDRGWGCGYRNAQMLISSLLTHTGYNERLYKLWQGQKPPRSSVPSISRLQGLIEQAWSQGFDVQVGKSSWSFKGWSVWFLVSLIIMPVKFTRNCRHTQNLHQPRVVAIIFIERQTKAFALYRQ